MTIKTLKDLDTLKGKSVTVSMYRDSSCNMAEVWLNDQCMMSGNDWDFHPHCHLGFPFELGMVDSYKGPASFAVSLIGALGRAGANVHYKSGKYDYNTGYHQDL